MSRALATCGALLALSLAASCAESVDTSARLAPVAADVPAARDAAPPDDAALPGDATGSDDAAPGEDATPADVEAPRFDPASPCVSDMRWTLGNRRSAYMNPGLACINCHARMRGPTYLAAGTLFYAPHEENLCDGFSGDPPNSSEGTAAVRLVDAAGVEVNVAVNRVGNFYTARRLAFPLQTVQVIGPTGRVSEMRTSPPHGDCNACHTQEGVDTPGLGMSPGRLTVPL